MNNTNNEVLIPYLKIEKLEYGFNFKVTSSKKLSREDLKTLNNMGLFGYGQSFIIDSTCDGTEVTDPSETLPSPLGKPYFDLQFYVYRVKNIVDSSD